MKKIKINGIKRPLAIALLSMLVTLSSFASEGGSSRTMHRFGLYVGFLGDPFPTLVGFNLGINLASFLRICGGYGTISASSVDATSGTTTTLSATTIGGGARLFVPGWNFSPTVGASYARVNLSGTGTTVGGFGASGSHTYLSAGFDWQANIGFNLGFGYNYSLLAGVGGLPYINLGWFF